MMAGAVTAVDMGSRAADASGAASAAVTAGTLITCARAGYFSRVRKFGTVEEASGNNYFKKFTLVGQPRRPENTAFLYVAEVASDKIFD